jgi:hypothetical protein
MAVSIAELQNSMASGLTPDDLSPAALNLAPTSMGPANHSAQPTAGAQVVPEPPVLILMLLGIPLLLARRRAAISK